MKLPFPTRFLQALIARLRLSETHALLVWAVPAGLAGVLATEAFKWAMWAAEQWLYGSTADLAIIARGLDWPMRLLMPTLGGLLAGALLMLARRWSQPGRHGEYMEAVTIGDGRIPVRETLARSASSLCSIVSGSSIGREGPMVQLAALGASTLGSRGLTPEALRLLVACGAAAGLTAAYNAPIASAIFVAEIVLGSLAIERLGPLIVASVVANVTMRSLPGYEPLYQVPAFPAVTWEQILLLALLGLVAGTLSGPYLRAFDAARQAFRRLAWPPVAALGLGGLLVGLVSIPFPQVWGNGYSVVNGLLHDPWTVQALIALLLAKVVATAIAAGSGAVGGVFTPTLFAGAALGAIFATAAQAVLPLHAGPGLAYVIVGMGAFLAASSRAPIMAMMMLFEMTLSYEAMLPLMLSCVLAYSVARAWSNRSIYAVTLRRNQTEQARLRLQGLRIGELIGPTDQVVGPDATLADVQHKFLELPVKYIYVLDAAGAMRGAVALQALNERTLHGLPIADEPVDTLLRHDFPTLTPQATVHEALQAFVQHIGERLPVVDPHSRRLLGVVSKVDLMMRLRDAL